MVKTKQGIHRIDVSDEKPSRQCDECDKLLPGNGWTYDNKTLWCDLCVVAKGLAQWWDINLRYPTVHTPTLAKGRFALQSIKDKTWIEQIEPMRWTANAKDARLFHSDYLTGSQGTNWQWSDHYAARSESQVREAGKKGRK